jgi:medium-chain acyl-[acyl-carrier-protein] hydrolase
MSSSSNSPWLAFRKPRPQARIRLFCFPYAGGGALIYRSWADDMPAEIEVCPVQLPGRERRLREPSFTHIDPLIDALVPALEPYFDMPFAFFGHSMGATIGYELAQRLASEGKTLPQHLVTSARRAPQLPPEDEKIYYALPADEFKERIREIQGTPEEVLDNEELMDLMLPLLRADFELVDTYPPSTAPPLDCPITAFGGLKDHEVPREELEAWGEVTSRRFRLRMFPGDHFFLNEDPRQVIHATAESLLRGL